MTASDRAKARERHVSDAVRVALGLSVLLVASLGVTPDAITRSERGAFEMLNGLTDWLKPLLWPVMQLGALGAVPVVAVAAVLLRRRSLALDAAVSGSLAWGAAKLLKLSFARPRPAGFIEDLTFRVAEPTGMGFVSGHTAVAVALATAAAPYVPRRFRWILVVLAGTVGVARIYVGAHLPLDVIGGAGLGWALAAAWRLALGAPTARPSTDRVEQGLRKRLDIEPVSLEPLDVESRVSSAFVLEVDGGQRLFLKVVTEEVVDRDVLVRLWRAVVRRRDKHEHRFHAPREQVDHEALISLAAERAGVRTPTLVLARTLDRSAGLLAFEHVDAPQVGAALEVSDAALADLFAQVGRLRSARIAHGGLVRENVLVADDRAWLVDFGFGELGASDGLLDEDLHELITSLSVALPPARVIAVARDTLGADVVGQALRCETVRWSPATRADIDRESDLPDRVHAAARA